MLSKYKFNFSNLILIKTLELTEMKTIAQNGTLGNWHFRSSEFFELEFL